MVPAPQDAGGRREHGRIARELHDRVGQSLAYVAISLDRLVSESKSRVGPGEEGEAAELEGPRERGAQGCA